MLALEEKLRAKGNDQNVPLSRTADTSTRPTTQGRDDKVVPGQDEIQTEVDQNGRVDDPTRQRDKPARLGASAIRFHPLPPRPVLQSARTAPCTSSSASTIATSLQPIPTKNNLTHKRCQPATQPSPPSNDLPSESQQEQDSEASMTPRTRTSST